MDPQDPYSAPARRGARFPADFVVCVMAPTRSDGTSVRPVTELRYLFLTFFRPSLLPFRQVAETGYDDGPADYGKRVRPVQPGGLMKIVLFVMAGLIVVAAILLGTHGCGGAAQQSPTQQSPVGIGRMVVVSPLRSG